MVDFLDILVKDAKKTITEGYYIIEDKAERIHSSLKEHIMNCKHIPIIAEIKPASPTHGRLRNIFNLKQIVHAIERGGASGISILTEPKHFEGSLRSLIEAGTYTKLPILMKDVIVDPIQIEAASRVGANAVLLIFSVYERNYAEYSIHEMIDFAHKIGLEVLLETHNKKQFLSALSTDADLIGINNRDLRNLNVDLNITKKILSEVNNPNKIIVSESGVQTPTHIRFLHNCGAKAFLIGSAIMLADDIEAKVRELVMAI
ncbi:indole-3-glycerol-phosphate synthase [Candidatus Bathyarchaeota archaeon]|nr:MAG: indole-3-glycerol-phosphate synthase [Candidatus Bathyarchaeota archaeon]